MKNKTFKMTVYYKYRVNQPYFEELYTGLTADRVEKINNRYDENMRDGDLVSLRIEIEPEP